MMYLLKLVYSTNDGSRYIVGEVCDAIVDSENAKKETGYQPSLIELKNGTVEMPWAVFIETNQSKFF